MEALQAELEHLQKQNQALRLMFEVMSSKYNLLHQAYLRESNSQLPTGCSGLTRFGLYDEYSNKRLRPEVPAVAKASQVFVKTDARDKSLVSDHHLFTLARFLCICVSVIIISPFNVLDDMCIIF